VKIASVWDREASMQEYEIRIVSEGNRHTVIEVRHLNDNAAVRSAKKLADGRPFEVWRDLDCVYGTASLPREPGNNASPTA
jgi:hypothetical protein